LSIAAAIATIKEMEKKKVIQSIWQKGGYLQARTNRLLKQNDLDLIIKVQGKPCWQVFIIKPANGYSDLEIKTFIQQEVLAAGILWYGQHNISYAHSQADLDRLLGVYKKVFPELKRLIEEKQLRQHLKGKPITNIFKVR